MLIGINWFDCVSDPAYWSFQNVFALDFGLFQSSNTQLKGSQIPVTDGL